MKYAEIGKSGVNASRVVLGCMRIANKTIEETEKLVSAALESGVTMFDHADIYGGGESEKKFGAAMKNLGADRDKIILQSKCGIRKGMFDFSKEHILSSVEGSLERLRTDRLDFLLLHRPDALVEPEEVASAFDSLRRAGKVLHFGVSNFSAGQLRLFAAEGIETAANQLQFSLMHAGMADEGFFVNMYAEESTQRGGEVLDYCRLEKITVQAWSPLNFGKFEGIFVGNEKFPELNAELNRLAEKYSCTPAAVAFAWILRHPAKMQVIAGTTNAERIKDLSRSADFSLTREEWYSLYRSTGKILP